MGSLGPTGRAIAGSTALLVLVLGACVVERPVASTEDPVPIVTIGSKDSTESVLLARLYGQVLEDHAYEVEYMLRIGDTARLDRAVTSGDIEMYPEYTGVTLVELMEDEASNDADAVYEQVAAWYRGRGLTALQMTPASDSPGLVVTRATSDAHGLSAISDLAAVSAELVLGGPPECEEDETCLVGLREVYGAEFERFEPIAQSGLKYQALLDGEIDVAVVFATDGAIAANDLVLLEDDEGLYPANNIIPVVRSDYVESVPGDFVEVINRVSSKITTAEIAALNAGVDIRVLEPEEVAHDWLHEQELISDDVPQESAQASAAQAAPAAPTIDPAEEGPNVVIIAGVLAAALAAVLVVIVIIRGRPSDAG